MQTRLRCLMIGIGLLTACRASAPEPESPSRAEPEGSPSKLDAADEAYETESGHDGAEWDDESSDESPSHGGFAPPPPAPTPPAQAAPAPESEPSRVEMTEDALDVDPLVELDAQQRASLAALGTSLSGESPDCDSAAVHRDRICDLAERICRLTRELPGSLKGKCEDGNARCKRAKSDYSRSCN